MKQEIKSYVGPGCRISTNPDVADGAPIITGTCVTVVNVLNHLMQGLSFHEVSSRLVVSTADIRACLIHARSNWPGSYPVVVLAASRD